MQSVPDWLALWREIVARQRAVDPEPAGPWTPENDPWRERAQHFAARSQRKWSRPDPLCAFVADELSPDDTLLDVGAGTGDWELFLAPSVHALTALEPSPAMRALLAQRVADAGAANVTVVPGYWPDAADVPAHDVVLCAHAIYGAPDFAAFVDRMSRTARRVCYLLLKLPVPEGVMAEAASRIWGQPHDSPNFVVAYNALIQMGIAADVRIDPTRWGTWKSPSIDEAVADVKRRLAITDTTAHDAFLRDLLGRRLTLRDGEYIWPPSVSSALVWWRTDR